jgi:hypothetical protein
MKPGAWSRATPAPLSPCRRQCQLRWRAPALGHGRQSPVTVTDPGPGHGTPVTDPGHGESAASFKQLVWRIPRGRWLPSAWSNATAALLVKPKKWQPESGYQSR